MIAFAVMLVGGLAVMPAVEEAEAKKDKDGKKIKKLVKKIIKKAFGGGNSGGGTGEECPTCG